jgi:hypothetical protein
MSDTAYVTSLPDCDLHKYGELGTGLQGGQTETAHYDGATTFGPWANMCEECFARFGRGLGTGKGQRLIVGEKPVLDRSMKQAAIDDAVQSGDLDLIEELVGDGDIAEWL